MANKVPGADPRTIRTPENARAFLSALSETCSVRKSCEIAGIGRQSAYEWRYDDADFAAQWKAALERGAEVLEDEAVRRAHDGVLKPIYQGGEHVGDVQEYSDTLMIFLLKGAKPKKYRDNVAVEQSGPDGGPIPVTLEIDL